MKEVDLLKPQDFSELLLKFYGDIFRVYLEKSTN